MGAQPESRYGRMLQRWFGGRQLWNLRWPLTRIPPRLVRVWWSGTCDSCGQPFRVQRGADASMPYCSRTCHTREKERRKRARDRAAADEARRAAITYRPRPGSAQMFARLHAAAVTAEEARVARLPPPAPAPAPAPTPAAPVLRPNLWPCPRPDKQVYLNEADADARRQVSWRLDPRIRPYECRCGFWHLGHPIDNHDRTTSDLKEQR